MIDATRGLRARQAVSSDSESEDDPIYLRESTYATLPKSVGPHTEVVYGSNQGLRLVVRDESYISLGFDGVRRIPLATPFVTRNLYLPLDRFGIGARATEPMIVEGTIPPNMADLSFAATAAETRKPRAFTANGLDLTGLDLAVAPGGCRYNLAIREKWTAFYISCPNSLLDRGWPISPSILSLITLRPQAWTLLSNLFTTIFQIAAEQPAFFQQSNVAKGVEESIELLLDEAIATSTGVVNRSRATASGHAIAQRIDAYLQKNLGRPVYNSDVCRDLGVSPRVLHDAVQTVMKMPLQRYLKLQRLWAVRRALIAAPPDALVKTIALDYGFWHLARFSADYAEFFGETPSMTIKKRHAAH